MRLAILAVVIGLAAAAHAQVDTGDSHAPPPRANLDLPRDALDFSNEHRDLHVPPAWRDVERASSMTFKPAADVVSERAPATLALKQLGAFHAAQRAIEEGHGDPAITMARDPLAELRRRFEEEPAEWLRTEIVVRLDSDGALAAATVVVSSGRHELDRQALRAVRRAVEGRRAAVALKGGTTVRFACDAGVVVPPPMLDTAQGDLRQHGVSAAMRIHFDETTGRVDPLVPFARRVVTRVQILDYHQ